MAVGRIRTIKPEFFTSPDTAKASVDARLFFIAMWCWADDYGIGETNLNALLGFAFPEDDQRERKEIQSLCKEVSEAYGVVFYTVRDRRFFAILSWDKHQKTQRRAARRNPRPDDPESVPDQRIYGQEGSSPPPQGISSRSQGNPPSGTGEQGNRGTGEEKTSSSAKPPTSSEPRPDVDALCTRLRDRIIENGNKEPAITKKWRTEARLLLDKDGREFDKALRLIDWCQQDSFWHSNILSMPKFREQYDQLRLKANQEYRSAAPASGPSKKEMAIAQAELLKENPDRELLRRAGLDSGPTVELRAIAGGLA